MSELKDKDEQYSIFLKYKEKNNNSKTKVIITVRIIVIMFFIVVLGAFISFIATNYTDIIGYIDKLNTSAQEPQLPTQKKVDLTPSKFNFKMLSRYQNILLLGVDTNGPNTLPFSGVRSDTIVILSIDVKNKSVNAISIPRDSKVYLADGHGIQKINSAYALGGIELTVKTIEETLGIKLHNYIIVNAQGVRELIDALGGIPIHIDSNMHYNDDSAKLHINLKKGDYVLDGKQSEEYLRYRKDALGDIGRVHRQQKFLKALIEKVKSPESLRKIPEAIKIASLNTRTDLNLYQMSQYAAIAREIDLNKVEFVMLPGAPNKKGIISYWILDPEKTQQVINRLIYRKKSEMTQQDISVGIIFSNTKETEAYQIREQLKNEGYTVDCTGKSSQISESAIIGFNTQVSKDIIKSMQKKVPEIEDLKYIHNSVRNFCSNSDVVITLTEKDIIEE